MSLIRLRSSSREESFQRVERGGALLMNQTEKSNQKSKTPGISRPNS